GHLTVTGPLSWMGWVSEHLLDEAEPHGAQPPRDRDPDGEAIQVALGHARGARGGGDTATEHVGQTTAATLVQQDEHAGEQAEDGQQDLKDELQRRQIEVDEHLPLRRADRSSIRHGPGPLRTRPAWDGLRRARPEPDPPARRSACARPADLLPFVPHSTSISP